MLCLPRLPDDAEAPLDGEVGDDSVRGEPAEGAGGFDGAACRGPGASTCQWEGRRSEIASDVLQAADLFVAKRWLGFGLHNRSESACVC